MNAIELSQLAIAPAETDADLEAMIHVRGLVTPGGASHGREPALQPRVERRPGTTSSPGWVTSRSRARSSSRSGLGRGGDIAVVPARRQRGIGHGGAGRGLRAAPAHSARTASRARSKESDADSRAFLERRGFTQVGAEKALVLELDGLEPPEIDPPAGVRIVTRAEEPDRLEEMYAVAVQADEDIPGSTAVSRASSSGGRTRSTSRASGASSASSRSPETRSSAMRPAGLRRRRGLPRPDRDRRDWRRRGVATALKRAEIAAAKRRRATRGCSPRARSGTSRCGS